MSDLKIAALYGFRPHMLGLCGPKEAGRRQLLKKFLLGKIPPGKMRPIFKKFMGAYGYYKLIAKSNKISDPFDKKVVEAYWIGNELLDKVKIGDLRKMITKDFSGPGLLPKEVAAKKAAAIPEGVKPHHSFHVLVIGSVTGSVDFKNTKLKDICRISWGRVVRCVIPARFAKASARRAKAGIHKSGFRVKHGMTNNVSKIAIEYRPLVGEKKIKLGKPIKKEIIWDKNLIPKIKIGDWVSFHWNYLVQILTKQEIANLKKYTLNTLIALE
ncbi:MAG: hypothetical protein LiPW39_287 [Parcubacteria group bacterium LiPW_39]|nr:MAG: hypothetical protein LiPW39_287 [Parcubacteria group bacterium LiPW_39]